MKTKISPKQQGEKPTIHRVAMAAFTLAFCMSMDAQTTSYDANSIPISGSDNAVFGANSMLFNSGGANTTIGFYGMTNNNSGSANTSGGYAAMYQNNSGNENTTFGVKSMVGNMGGNQNTAIGSYALMSNNYGNQNSAVGAWADVANGLNNATAIGANSFAYMSNQLFLGDGVTDVWTNNNYYISDGRFKKNVDTRPVKGLEFIKLLRPVVYNFDGAAFTQHITKSLPDSVRKHYMARDFSSRDNVIQTGFIAQEVEQAAKTAGYNFSGVYAPKTETETYGVSYYQFVVPLVKAVQEQQAMIDGLLKEVAELKKAAGTTGVSVQTAPGADFAMGQNEPNPFTRETVVKYTLPESVNTAYMAVYDLSGKQITTLPINQKGSASMSITSDKLAAGIYIYSIVADGKVVDSKRMIVSEK